MHFVMLISCMSRQRIPLEELKNSRLLRLSGINLTLYKKGHVEFM